MYSTVGESPFLRHFSPEAQLNKSLHTSCVKICVLKRNIFLIAVSNPILKSQYRIKLKSRVMRNFVEFFFQFHRKSCAIDQI